MTTEKPGDISMNSLESKLDNLSLVTEGQKQEQDKKVKIGYCFDEKMLLHKDFQNKHQECPERAMVIYTNLVLKNLTQNLIRVPCEPAPESEIKKIHTEEYHDTIKSLQFDSNNKPRNQFETKKTLKEKDSYDNYYTYQASLMAVGSLMSLSKMILQNKLDYAFGIIRPPGHHADMSNCHGFCFFNSVAITANYLVEKHKKKIAIIDWDVHHGDGTQKIFYNKKNPLFISVHRHDAGKFYPFVTGFTKEHGEEEGNGFNLNIPLDTKISITNGNSAIGDAEYILMFDKIIIPVLNEYDPDIILISCGFDAGENDFSGCLKCTPITYAYMTKRLMMMNKKLIFALEGGYTLDTIQRCSEAIFRTLLGEETPFKGTMIGNYESINKEKITLNDIIQNYDKIFKPIPYVVEQLNAIIKEHSSFWKSLQGKEIPVKKVENAIRKNKFDSSQNNEIEKLLKEKGVVIENYQEFEEKYPDYIVFKIGKELLNESSEKTKSDKFKALRKKISSMKCVQHNMGFNLDSIKFTKLRANATKMTKLLNWTKSELKYDMNDSSMSQILTLFFQHLGVKTEEILSQMDGFVARIRDDFESKYDLFNVDLIIAPKPPEAEPQKAEEDTKKKLPKFKPKKKQKVNLLFYIGNIKEEEGYFTRGSRRNFISGIESLRNFIKDNVMN